MAKGKVKPTDKVIEDILKLLRNSYKNKKQLRKKIGLSGERLDTILNFMKKENLIEIHKLGKKEYMITRKK